MELVVWRRWFFLPPGSPCPPYGRFYDIDGNGFIGFNDVVVYYNAMEDTDSGSHGPVQYFDFDRNGWVGFNDVVRLYNAIDSCMA